MLRTFFVLVLAMSGSNAHAITEFVALAPAAGPGGATIIEWINMTYAEDVSRASEVEISLVSSSQSSKDLLGRWYGLDTGGLSLTAKIYEDKLYALKNDGNAPNSMGCCANMLTVYPRDAESEIVNIEIGSLIQDAVNASDAYASHTFDIDILNDKIVAFFQVRYGEDDLDGAPCDAIVAVDVEDKKIVPTKDARSCFNIYREAGTTSTEPKDSRFKVQFYTDTGSDREEWHGNGVQRFATLSGMKILAFTHRMMAEAVLFQDPWAYTRKDGGGQILQRFGTPKLLTSDPEESSSSSYRYFGLDSSASAFVSGVHNVFYRSKSPALDGSESVSLFVNTQDGKSAAYEFALKLVEEGSKDDTGDDTTFQTTYVSASCTFTAPAQGGARAIGDGVFAVMSGADHTGLEIDDISGGESKSQAYPGGIANLYDPFIFIVTA